MAQIRPGEQVLDVACGTGLVTFPAAKAVGERGKVVGTDISEKMIKGAREEAEGLGSGQATFERMDAEALKFGDAEFDVVLCSLGLMYVPDPLASIKEMHRVLKPGGRAVIANWGAGNRCGWSDIFQIVDARVQSDVCPMFFALGVGDSLSRACEEAGFSEVDALRLTTPLHYDSAEDAIGAAFAGGPVALAYSRFDEKTREEAHAEYLTSIRPYLKDGAYDIPGEFIVVRGDKS